MMVTPFSFLMASYASDRDWNLTRADPVNTPIFLISLDSMMEPY